MIVKRYWWLEYDTYISCHVVIEDTKAISILTIGNALAKAHKKLELNFVILNKCEI